VTQVRTFVYDETTGRLASETLPETGTTSYVWNQDGTLGSKTQAKGNRVESSYDSYKRVTEMRSYDAAGLEIVAERVDFTYDTDPFGGGS